MNVTFRCPECEQTSRVEVAPSSAALSCPHCHTRLRIPEGAIVGHGVTRCLVCPSTELFVRKDFPQQLGVAIVALGIAVSCYTWFNHWLYWTFGVFFATALADVLLYFFMPDALVCYRCGAHYRSVDNLDKHGAFDLATHERFRQQAIRLAESSRRSGAG
jgi:uncharacterized protein YbaR (Trm112 family)